MKILDQVRSRFTFLLIGYVVMPEHVHLLMSEPEKGNPSKALQVLKQKVSRSLRRPTRKPSAQLSLGFVNAADSPAFWQRRFYDFNVWSERKVREKLDYMHRNPVQRKLVSHPKDWPWSSWSHYEKGETGLIRIDTFGEERILQVRWNRRVAPGKVKDRTLEQQRVRHPISLLRSAGRCHRNLRAALQTPSSNQSPPARV